MDPSSPNDQAKFAQALTLPEVYAWMNTGPDGLSHSEAFERLKIHGRNVLPRVDAGRFPALAANFTHLMAMLLWAGGSIALLAGLPELGVAIWLVNLINGLFSYWQEHKAERLSWPWPGCCQPRCRSSEEEKIAGSWPKNWSQVT